MNIKSNQIKSNRKMAS